MKAKENAFTLVELLVVTCVVIFLAAIALPVIANATKVAKRSNCAANMRQIGIALQTYANDHEGDLPETTHTASLGSSWIAVLAPYLQAIDRIRICPADPKGKERLKAGGTSYILNSFIFTPQLDPFGQPIGVQANNLRRIPVPSRTILAFVISDDRGVGASNDHTHSENWDRGWKKLLYDIEPDRHRSGARSKDRTNGESNYLFADGHVETISAAEVKRLLDEGVNFARPPES